MFFGLSFFLVGFWGKAGIVRKDRRKEEKQKEMGNEKQQKEEENGKRSERKV